MDNLRHLKGVKALIDAREYLRSKIVIIIEVIEQTKGLKKKAIEEEEVFIKEMLGEIRSLNEKIKRICTKTELSLEDSGFVDEWQNELIFRISICNRRAKVEGHLHTSTSQYLTEFYQNLQSAW